MSSAQETQPIVTPGELSTRSLPERAEAAERVRQMCDTDAWTDLRRGIAGKQAAISAYLMGLPGDRDPGVVMKLIGEMVGVAGIPVIAEEIIADGEAAAQEIRAREEGS